MKILICCAGGFSSSIVENKLRKYGDTIGEEIVVSACGTGAVEEKLTEGYEVLLYAPQVRNRAKELKAAAETAGVPCDQMNPQDYAIANAEKIYKLAKKLVDNK